MTNNNGKWFGYPDGTYENNGFKKINECIYYFQSNGYVKTGWLLEKMFGIISMMMELCRLDGVVQEDNIILMIQERC